MASNGPQKDKLVSPDTLRVSRRAKHAVQNEVVVGEKLQQDVPGRAAVVMVVSLLIGTTSPSTSRHRHHPGRCGAPTAILEPIDVPPQQHSPRVVPRRDLASSRDVPRLGPS